MEIFYYSFFTVCYYLLIDWHFIVFSPLVCLLLTTSTIPGKHDEMMPTVRKADESRAGTQTSDITVQNLYPISPQSQVSRGIHTAFLAHSRLQKVSDQVPGTRARIQGAFSLPLKGKPQYITYGCSHRDKKGQNSQPRTDLPFRFSMRFSPALCQTHTHSKVHFCSKSKRLGYERQICKGKWQIAKILTLELCRIFKLN